MKKNIHPKYVECKVTCSCGNTFTTHSTKPELKVDICNECHPFFTGQQKFVDTGGRVQRFESRFSGAAANIAAKVAEKKAARAKELEEESKKLKEIKAQKAEKRAAKRAAFEEKQKKADLKKQEEQTPKDEDVKEDSNKESADVQQNKEEEKADK